MYSAEKDISSIESELVFINEPYLFSVENYKSALHVVCKDSTKRVVFIGTVATVNSSYDPEALGGVVIRYPADTKNIVIFSHCIPTDDVPSDRKE